MAEKAMPRIDIYFHMGARVAYDCATLEEAKEKAFPKKKLSASQMKRFERGYLHGKITDCTNDFTHWMRYMDFDQLKRLGASLRELRDKHNEELSRDDAPYQIGKLEGLPKEG